MAQVARLLRRLAGRDRLVARAVAAVGGSLLATATIAQILPIWPPMGLPLALAAAALAILAIASLADDERRIGIACRRAVGLLASGGEAPDSVSGLAGLVDRLADALATVEQRLLHRHPISGLPTREPLLRAIAPGGTVGVIHLADLDRLYAFDEPAAEQLLVALAGRLLGMIGGQRLAAQVDRARIAIWYGPDIPAAGARAQLDALAYALGGTVAIGEGDLLPVIRVTSALAEDGHKPAAILARAIVGAAPAGPATGDDPLGLARDRFSLEQDLRRAVERGELELHYQPLIDARAARPSGAEALLRWRHPHHGLLPPGRFIPLMESAGLADEIGLWALDAACREARQLMLGGVSPFRVAVNVSGAQLDGPDLGALVERILARHGLAGAALEIELTETVATADGGRAARLIERLRQLGVAVAIDDFGTGYSSLSSLRALRFTKLKIDREFVTAVERRRDSQAICRSMLALGQGLGIRVLAEGVETAAEYLWLRAQGCNHFQGFYFARPLLPTALRDYCADTAGLERLLRPTSVSQRLRA